LTLWIQQLRRAPSDRVSDVLRASVTSARRRARIASALARAAVADRRGSSPAEAFSGLDEATWEWLHLHGMARSRSVANLLPRLAPEDIQARTTGSSGRQSLREGFGFYSLVRDQAALHLGGIDRCSVLDFGCGWGRILRFFVKDVPKGRLFGTDVVPELAALTRSTNPWATITLNGPLPPLDFPDKSLDLVYLYSVFSHLSEEAHAAWMNEFARILRPGGLVVATTWPREYIEWCAAAREGRPSPVHHPAALRAFPETERWLAAYDAGEFCHTATGAGGNTLAADFYGETCVPRGYAERHWSGQFDLLDFIDDRAQSFQNVLVGRRRESDG